MYCKKLQIRVCNKRGCCLYLMRSYREDESGLFLEVNSETVGVSGYKLQPEKFQKCVK